MFENALILAGGLGKRLRPLTHAIPKPLLPVGEKPIIEKIIEDMRSQGIVNFYISVNYKGEMIKNYLKDGESLGVNIEYIEEDKFTGTAGSIINLPDELNEDMVICNGDVINNVDFQKVFDLLHKNDFDFVITSIKKGNYIDFGVLEFDNDSKQLNSWKEKPTQYFNLNAGIYGIRKETIKFIKEKMEKNTKLDMPDFWEFLMKNNKKIGIYEHNGEWVDIGRINDYLEIHKGEEN
jgi:NDP-sugar pyrophosphorylase family protein